MYKRQAHGSALAGDFCGTGSAFYILPSLYHSDLDRGFSVVDYNLNEELATIEDLSQLKELGIMNAFLVAFILRIRYT